MRFFSAVLAVLCITGCVSLNAGGAMVQYVTKAEAPKTCKLIGEVAVGVGASGFQTIPQSAGDTKILMRNQVAKMGGNFLVVDDISSRPEDEGSMSFAGSGRAYQCPQNELRPTVAPAATP